MKLPLVQTPELHSRTHCPYCAFQCGILMTESMDAEGWTVAGDPHFPVNNGQLCIKGWTSAALLRHPARVTQPQIRVNGKWQTATWDSAYDVIVEGWNRLKAQHGPDTNGVFGSGALSNEKTYLLGKFARLALGTARIDYNGRYCMASAAGAMNRAFGVDRGMPFPVSDIGQTEVVCLVGSNPADTLPPIMQWFEKQQASGGRRIVIDPRRTPTARNADLHMQITPGTDLALANGLLYLAIEEKLTKPEYIEERTTGYDAMYRIALEYDPARVERLTGVPERQMRQAVRWLAQAQSAMILSGRGQEQHSKGVDSVHAWINLALALGRCGKPFSGFGTLTGQGNGQGGREHGQKADQLPGYRLIENEADREYVAKVWNVDPKTLPRKGPSAYELLDSDIKSLFVMGSNVAVASPNLNRIEAKLKALEMLVVCDSFHNETSAYAHVFLPTLQWSEEDGTMTNLEGRVIRRRQATMPPIGPKSDRLILEELAARLGTAGFAYPSNEAVFDELRVATSGAVADYNGITYARIEAENGMHWPCPTTEHPGTPRLFETRFHHANGKAKFFPVTHRPAGEEIDGDYPIWFTTGRYKEHYNSGAQTRLVKKLVTAQLLPRLEIHPRLAAQYGIRKGSRVVIESRRGKVEFTADVTPDIRPDTVFAPFHWGGIEAANRLTSPHLDPVSRMPEFKLAAVRIGTVTS
ncbi:MAG: molybdopterin oxidoreductase family protein [Fimbriiglobus sp.]